MKNRQEFNSSIDMILATTGSAVVAGNIWRFSYVAGKSVSGAFLIFYLFMIFLIGMPLMISEIAIGRKGQKDAKNSFKQIYPNKNGIM
ncbi:hypothetical protein ABGF48_05780 [Helcococcus bovis]|uniref:hypothetical protein n=1 Tax=Helcococcus bovis TaxID=3153252 RepID=UPI0038B9C7D3